MARNSNTHWYIFSEFTEISNLKFEKAFYFVLHKYLKMFVFFANLIRRRVHPERLHDTGLQVFQGAQRCYGHFLPEKRVQTQEQAYKVWR
jgi:hypothetical protein